jgi:hypothetical protein
VAKLCSFPSFHFSWKKLTEGNDKCSTESVPAVKTLLLKPETQHYEHFMQHMVKKLLIDLVQDCEMTMQRHFNESKECYNSALSYLKAWNKHKEDLTNLSCLLLDKVSTRENSDNVISWYPQSVKFDFCSYQSQRGSE